MKIDVSVVIRGVPQDQRPQVTWPEGWPVPSKGDPVEIPGAPSLKVEVVEWWPHGDPENSEPEPYVHVILGSGW